MYILVYIYVLKLQPRLVLNAEPSPNFLPLLPWAALTVLADLAPAHFQIPSAALRRHVAAYTAQVFLAVLPRLQRLTRAWDAHGWTVRLRAWGGLFSDAPPAGILRLAPAPTQPLPYSGPSCGSHRWSGSLRWRRTRSLASNGMRSA